MNKKAIHDNRHDWVEHVKEGFRNYNIPIYTIHYSENSITVLFNGAKLTINTNKDFKTSSKLKNNGILYGFIHDNIPKNCYHNQVRFVHNEKEQFLSSTVHCVNCGKGFPAAPLLNKILDHIDENETRDFL
jgi:hypothetical protein